MPGKLRLEYPGAMYHPSSPRLWRTGILSRGDQREDIFLDDVDRHDFIKTLAEASQKTGWQVHAYCLMRNHYHLVLEAAEARAERILEEELTRLHWTRRDLESRPKSDPTKLALAARMRQETMLSVKQIAERLHLGKPKGARTNLHKFLNPRQSGTAQTTLNI